MPTEIKPGQWFNAVIDASDAVTDVSDIAGKVLDRECPGWRKTLRIDCADIVTHDGLTIVRGQVVDK